MVGKNIFLVYRKDHILEMKYIDQKLWTCLQMWNQVKNADLVVLVQPSFLTNEENISPDPTISLVSELKVSFVFKLPVTQ